jgi:citrate synthase
MTSEQALAALGTKPQSLYASVSRGRIRMKPDPRDPRKSLYSGDDVTRLAARASGRRKAETVAADTMRWGEPVLPSAITTITGGRLYYRGHDAAELAETATLEDIATLLWESPSVDFSAPASSAVARASTIAPLRRGFAVIADRAATDPPALGRSLPVLRAEANGIVGALAAALGATGQRGPVHQRLADAWQRPTAADAIRRMLVLLADHELNASTFAARVTASTGAALAAAVLTGLAAVTGPLHGSAPASLLAVLALADREDPNQAVRLWLAQGRPLPTFGHRLYPDGDIRAKTLLEGTLLPPAFAAIAAAAREMVGEEPTVDFALAVLAAVYDLPRGAPLLLFSIARSVGWLAHALEQLETGTLIRSRAHYVGIAPIVA